MSVQHYFGMKQIRASGSKQPKGISSCIRKFKTLPHC